MNKKKIAVASKALKQLEKAQDQFNEAVNSLNDEELAEWCKLEAVTIEPSEAKLRIQKMIDSKKEEEKTK